MYYVYILKCKDGSLYTGITTDVQRRFAEHKAGKGGAYTRSHVPTKILYTERKKNRSTASRREASIKSLSKSEKLQLIKNTR